MSLKEIQLNPSLAMSSRIHVEVDQNTPELEIQTEETPEISRFKNEREMDELQMNCEQAIASYLNTIKEGARESGRVVESLQKEVIEVLGRHVRYQGHSVTPIHTNGCTCCHVIPPYMIQNAEKINRIAGPHINGTRQNPSNKNKISATPLYAVGKEPLISVYSAKGTENLPGVFVTSNQQRKSTKDATVKQAIAGAKAVYRFFLNNFGLNSYNGSGAPLKSTVHYGDHYANAFWNGQQIVFGDGDAKHRNFTELSIVGHEFGHAVTGNKLNYQGEAGALNEHLSDVWGSLIMQYEKKQKSHEASWLIGEGILKAGTKSFPLRSMKSPGLAYSHPQLGKDPQPSHYSQKYIGTADNGGVHYNSGIPNKAFYLFAMSQGGYAWEKAGKLWYLTLKTENLIKPNCTMPEFAHATLLTAMKHYPTDYKMHTDLINAWKAVGLA